jgi:hypothetical protein
LGGLGAASCGLGVRAQLLGVCLAAPVFRTRMANLLGINESNAIEQAQILVS